VEIFASAGPGSKSHCDGARSSAPEETIARVMALKSVFGVTRIANLTGLDRVGIPVVMVCRPNARSSAVFHGKGVDVAQAKASGLMEAVETWHAEYIQLPLRFGSYADLGEKFRLVDVEGLPRTPGRQFDPSSPMLWVEGRDLMSRGDVWLPVEIVHANSTRSGPPTSGGFSASTNGLASGNHILEAVSCALCEAIERDATSIWRRSPPDEQQRRRLDLATIGDPKSLAVLDLLKRAQLDIAIWDVTTDIGAPAFQCIVMDLADEYGHVGIGAGCYPKPEIALLRAILEAAQVRTTYIVGSREDILAAGYDPATLSRRNSQARGLLRSPGKRDFRAAAGAEFDTFEAEINWLLDRLRSVGVKEVAAVDLTRPEFGIPVVRVVAPGLEGSDHDANYAPGPRARAAEGRMA
jgi:ribosomal protein S12 methylthiotransferase accessory factor